MTPPIRSSCFWAAPPPNACLWTKTTGFLTWRAQILEQETGAKINSYNGGMSGSNTLNAIDILINKVIPLKPGVVVFMENINDLSTLLYEGTYWNRRTPRSPLETLKKRQLVGKLLKEIFIPNLNHAYRNLKKTLSAKEEDEFAGARGKKLID